MPSQNMPPSQDGHLAQDDLDAAAKAAQLAEVKVAMLAELGSSRLNDLPLEDGKHRPAARGLSGPGRDGIVPASQANMDPRWKLAIEGGEFDDYDAEQVKDLDAIANGRLHVLNREVSGSNGARGALPSNSSWSMGPPSRPARPRSKPVPQQNRVLNLNTPIKKFDPLANGSSSAILRSAAQVSGQRQASTALATKESTRRVPSTAVHSHAVPPTSRGPASASRPTFETDYVLPKTPPPGSRNCTQLPIESFFPPSEGDVGDIFYRGQAQYISVAKNNPDVELFWTILTGGGEPVLWVFIMFETCLRFDLSQWKSRITPGGHQLTVVFKNADTGIVSNLGLQFGDYNALLSFVEAHATLAKMFKSQPKQQAPVPAKHDKPLAQSTTKKAPEKPAPENPAPSQPAAQQTVKPLAPVSQPVLSAMANGHYIKKASCQRLVERAVQQTVKLSPPAQLILSSMPTGPAPSKSPSEQIVEPPAESGSSGHDTRAGQTRRQADDHIEPSEAQSKVSPSEAGSVAAAKARTPLVDIFLDPLVVDPPAKASIKILNAMPLSREQEQKLIVKDSCTKITSEVGKLMRLADRDEIGDQEYLRERLLEEMLKAFEGIKENRKKMVKPMLMGLIHNALDPSPGVYQPDELKSVRSKALPPPAWLSELTATMTRLALVYDSKTTQESTAKGVEKAASHMPWLHESVVPEPSIPAQWDQGADDWSDTEHTRPVSAASAPQMDCVSQTDTGALTRSAVSQTSRHAGGFDQDELQSQRPMSAGSSSSQATITGCASQHGVKHQRPVPVASPASQANQTEVNGSGQEKKAPPVSSSASPISTAQMPSTTQAPIRGLSSSRWADDSHMVQNSRSFTHSVNATSSNGMLDLTSVAPTPGRTARESHSSREDDDQFFFGETATRLRNQEDTFEVQLSSMSGIKARATQAGTDGTDDRGCQGLTMSFSQGSSVGSLPMKFSALEITPRSRDAFGEILPPPGFPGSPGFASALAFAPPPGLAPRSHLAPPPGFDRPSNLKSPPGLAPSSPSVPQSSTLASPPGLTRPSALPTPPSGPSVRLAPPPGFPRPSPTTAAVAQTKVVTDKMRDVNSPIPPGKYDNSLPFMF